MYVRTISSKDSLRAAIWSISSVMSDSVSAGIRDGGHQVAVDEDGRATVVWAELYAQGKVRVMFARF
jgi:hypothetical protein